MTLISWPKRLSVLSIIFDLDDTLIDTSGTIIPQYLAAAFVAMQEAGYSGPGLEELFTCYKTTPTTLEAFTLFLKDQPKKDFFYQIAVSVLGSRNFTLTPQTTPLAINILEKLSREIPLFLVTVGSESLQRLKLEKAGISSMFFSRIIVCQEGGKKEAYRGIIQAMSCEPREVLVCGDRIERDLRPAKELGCRTVHIRWGRGALEALESPFVDRAIKTLEELLTW